MDTKPKIKLPDEWIKRSSQWAKQLVANYANGRNERSRSVSCFDAEYNEELQAKAKMCECAFALWLDQDPGQHVHWGAHPDNGSDLLFADMKWDVKSTKIGGRYLVWPIAKNHLFNSKKFTALMLIKHKCPEFVMSGWISKIDFASKHLTAPELHALFPGTWYMDEETLHDPASLERFLPKKARTDLFA